MEPIASGRTYIVGSQPVAPTISPEVESYRSWEKMVCDIFIKAVLEHDRATIIELADAAAFFKGKLEDDYVPADPIRLKLIKIKEQPRLFQRTFTIRQVAEKVYAKMELESRAADGFSALRRLCKELKIKIRPSRKIRGK